MGFLTPLLLALGAAVAIPIVLHLLHRQQGRRLIFPALRYLRTAEKDHARRIRLRQWLLLALRCGVILLLAGAAARPFIRGIGEGHEPTAVAMILDNSLSSGVVEGDRRLIEEYRDRALATLERAGEDDRFWLIRAGAPWEPALPGTAEQTAERVRATEPTSAAADLAGSLARARSLLAAGAEGRAREIHLITDLQATALRGIELAAESDPPPVVVWAPGERAPDNAGITAVQVGGGLAPRAGQRSVVTARVSGTRAEDSVAVRLVLDGRVAAAGVAAVDGEATLPFPPRAAGVMGGWVEIDADALRGDDRRYFVARVRPPPSVAAAGSMPYVEEALDVLAEAGRVRRTQDGDAEVVLSPGGAGLEALRDGRSVIVTPPATALELPATNRRLAAAELPWRFGPGPGGERRFETDESDELGRSLAGVRLRQVHGLERQGGATGEDDVLLRLRDGTPWAVAGQLHDGGRYVVLASPLTPEASTLPTGAALVPLLDRAVGGWAAAEPTRAEVRPGEPVLLPAGAERVEGPDGETLPVRQGETFLAPATAGVYRIMAGNRLLDAFAVNAPASESDLARLDARALRSVLPGWSVRVVHDSRGWERSVFQVRHGREVWRPVLLLVLLLLVVEGLIAAAGRGRSGAAEDEPVQSRRRPPRRGAAPAAAPRSA